MTRTNITRQQSKRLGWRRLWRTRGWLTGRNWLRSRVTGWPE